MLICKHRPTASLCCLPQAPVAARPLCVIVFWTLSSSALNANSSRFHCRGSRLVRSSFQSIHLDKTVETCFSYVDSSRLVTDCPPGLHCVCFTHCHLLDLKSLAVPSTVVLAVVRSFLTSARFLESCDVFGQPQLQISPPGSLRSFSDIQ